MLIGIVHYDKGDDPKAIKFTVEGLYCGKLIDLKYLHHKAWDLADHGIYLAIVEAEMPQSGVLYFRGTAQLGEIVHTAETPLCVRSSLSSRPPPPSGLDI